MHIMNLKLSRLVIKDLHVLDMLPSELDKVLMCWILAHIVVSVCFALELDHEAVSKGALYLRISSHPSVTLGIYTAWPSLLLFLPPEKDLIYGFCEVALKHLSFKASIRLHAYQAKLVPQSILAEFRNSPLQLGHGAS